jgi:hypothetical protein
MNTKRCNGSALVEMGQKKPETVVEEVHSRHVVDRIENSLQ